VESGHESPSLCTGKGAGFLPRLLYVTVPSSR
jgi:hypothetical protein